MMATRHGKTLRGVGSKPVGCHPRKDKEAGDRGPLTLEVTASIAVRCCGLGDWDRAEVFNDVGRFIARVKPSPIHLLELVGGYPFLDPTFMIRQPA